MVLKDLFTGQQWRNRHRREEERSLAEPRASPAHMALVCKLDPSYQNQHPSSLCTLHGTACFHNLLLYVL